MRILKFRLWRFEEKEMIPGDALAFEEYMPLEQQLNQKGIMQFTGFTDNNNEEIYEGDLLLRHRNDEPIFGEVVFKDGCWMVVDSDGDLLLSLFAKHCEIIGHIFEQKED